MELAMLGRALPRRRLNAVHLPAYVLMPLYLAVGLTITTAALLVVARRESPPNPFVDYAALMPGSPRSAATTRGFACAAVSVFDGETCSHVPSSWAFAHVYLVVAHDSITETRFTLRPDTINAGDLVLWWGAPAIQVKGRFVELFWPSSGVMALAPLSPDRQFSYFTPVVHVTFAKGESNP